jgi:hypothetical protein
MDKQSSTLPEPFLGATDDGIHGADFLPDLEQNLHRGRLGGRRKRNVWLISLWRP